MGNKEKIHAVIVGVQTCTVTKQINAVNFQKDGNQSISCFGYTALGIYTKDTLSYHKDNCSNTLIATLVLTSTNWKQPKLPSKEP